MAEKVGSVGKGSKYPPLIFTHPGLVYELVDPSFAEILSRGSDKIVDWYCALEHPYPASVANRVAGKGCPFCTTSPYLSDLATRDIAFARRVLEQIRTQSHCFEEGVESKICVRCFVTKPLAEFYRNAKSKDGLKPYCKECGKSASLKWTREHVEANRLRANKWYQENQEKGIKRSAEWAAKNSKLVTGYKKKYAKANPEVVRAVRQRRRVRLKGGETEKFRDTEIFERDGWICQLCQQPIEKELKSPSPGSVSLDHIQPVSLGGPHTWDNVQTAHLRCNKKKSNKHPDSIEHDS